MTGPESASGTPSSIREPAVAGSFYPADASELDRLVDALVADAAAVTTAGGSEPVDPGELRGLIVPHAGLVYSGAVAAGGWRSAAGWAAPRTTAAPGATILLAGTDHTYPFDGIAVWDGGPWRTPGAETAIADGWRRALLGLGGPWHAAAGPHLREHSIEVQLPLLARLAPDLPIVPFVVGPGDDDPLGAIAAGARLGRLVAAAAEELGPALVVASSDLAHYPAHALAREVDDHVLEPVLRLDAEELRRRELAVRRARLPGVACGMCGVEPVLLVLAAARTLGARRGILLDHRTSADIPGGDPDRVVGYAAVALV